MSNENTADKTTFSTPRRRQRYPLTLPLRVLIHKLRGRGSQPARCVSETITENISSSGCYFLLDRELGVRDKVELEVFMQPKSENVSSGRAVCKGRVVRVDKAGQSGKVGIACTIDHYRLTAATEA